MIFQLSTHLNSLQLTLSCFKLLLSLCHRSGLALLSSGKSCLQLVQLCSVADQLSSVLGLLLLLCAFLLLEGSLCC